MACSMLFSLKGLLVAASAIAALIFTLSKAKKRLKS